MIKQNLNLTEQLVHNIGRKIIHGEISPAEVLPKVETLSEEVGVSRTVVREAFKGLSSRGLVKSNPKVGTVVRSRAEWQWWDSDVLSWATTQEDNRSFLYQLTEVRLALEPSAAKLAAKKATKSDLENITKCYQALERSVGDVEAWAEADYNFHNSIILASHNELIYNLLSLLRTALVQSRVKSRESMEMKRVIPYETPTEEVLTRHRVIYEAVHAKDEDKAYERMYQLILRVLDLLENTNGS